MKSDPCAIALAPHAGQGRADLAIARLQRQARSTTRSSPLIERLGWAYVAAARVSTDPGYYELAEQAALCIESQTRGSPEALLLHGHVSHSLHRFEEAETFARELVAKRGLSFDYGLLGDALMEQGELREAVAAYQQMMDQRPGPQSYSRAAHMRWLKGDLPGAIELMEMAVGASDSRAPESAAWAQVRLALYELQAGDLKTAVLLIEAALALQNDYPPALLALGRIELAENQPTQAIDSLQRAAALDPLPEYLWVLSEALRAANRIEEARGVETQLMRRGAIDDPRTFSLYLSSRGEDAETAIRLANRELGTRADVFTLDSLAWALRAAGRIGEARPVMERALAEGTKDARLFYHAGVIARASGRNDAAKGWFEKAAAIRQMLLPSEKEGMSAQAAALRGSGSTLVSNRRTTTTGEIR